jgi:hypothetical protein
MGLTIIVTAYKGRPAATEEESERVAVKRSRHVRLTVVPLLAAAFVACGSEEEQAYCVNENDEVVENSYCGDDDSGGSGAFFWYFGGRALTGGTIVRGTRLRDGERIVSTDKAAIRSRGGFGSSARGSAIGARTVSG